jgi:hypothetical protein
MAPATFWGLSVHVPFASRYCIATELPGGVRHIIEHWDGNKIGSDHSLRANRVSNPRGKAAAISAGGTISTATAGNGARMIAANRLIRRMTLRSFIARSLQCKELVESDGSLPLGRTMLRATPHDRIVPRPPDGVKFPGAVA